MSDIKTKVTRASVAHFINAIKNEGTRHDCGRLIEIMSQISKEEPKMWGSSIVGFGHYHYKYDSGREGDTLRIGFSPRSNNISIYMVTGLGLGKNLIKTLGKFKAGKSCLYIKKLSDVDEAQLAKILTKSFTTQISTR